MESSFSHESLLQFSELVRSRTGVSEYDFARCVRPDGSVYGSRGKCRKGSETAAETQAPKQVKTKRTKNLEGQALANAMMQYVNIENRVRANNKGSLATKKAKLELESELKKEGVPPKAKLREMALAQREREMAPARKVKDTRELSRRLTTLRAKFNKAKSTSQLKKLREELKVLEREIRSLRAE